MSKMKVMICKQEKGFEPVFFEINTLDDLLNALCEYSYPPIQINIEDDEHGDPRMGIEIFDDCTELLVAGRPDWTMEDEIEFRMPVATKPIHINPKKMRRGTCRIDESLGERLVVCMSDDRTIRIFRVETDDQDV